SRRDRSVPQAPGEAMCPLRATVHGERAVAAVSDRPLPEMAAGDWIDLGVVGKPPLDGPARAAVQATLLHATQNTCRPAGHLLWAMAAIFRQENQAAIRLPLPIMRLATEGLSTGFPVVTAMGFFAAVWADYRRLAWQVPKLKSIRVTARPSLL